MTWGFSLIFCGKDLNNKTSEVGPEIIEKLPFKVTIYPQNSSGKVTIKADKMCSLRKRTWARTLHSRKQVMIRKVKNGIAAFSSEKKNISQTVDIIEMHNLLTVAKSFWVRPLSCLPCWMTLPTSRVTLSWCSSSVSLSSLAVFFVTRCCLFCPADPERQAAVNSTAVEADHI